MKIKAPKKEYFFELLLGTLFCCVIALAAGYWKSTRVIDNNDLHNSYAIMSSDETISPDVRSSLNKIIRDGVTIKNYSAFTLSVKKDCGQEVPNKLNQLLSTTMLGIWSIVSFDSLTNIDIGIQANNDLKLARECYANNQGIGE